MSEAAILTVVSGVVTVTTLIIGFLTLWLKLRYGIIKAEEAAYKAENVEQKIDRNSSAISDKLDHNTMVTTEAKNAAVKAEHQTNGVMKHYQERINDHDSRIGALEAQISAMKESVAVVAKNIDTTRHEMRGHLQTITNKLDIMVAVKAPSGVGRSE